MNLCVRSLLKSPLSNVDIMLHHIRPTFALTYDFAELIFLGYFPPHCEPIYNKVKMLISKYELEVEQYESEHCSLRSKIIMKTALM